jgi:hypothetical protein
LILFVQVPPFKQGDERQVLISFAQEVPLKPEAQVQVQLLILLLQVAPFKQGEERQVLISVAQVVPL